MRSSEFQVSGIAVSSYAWLPADHHIETIGISFHVLKTGTGDVTYTIEGTLSNLETGGINVEIVSAKAFDIVSAKTSDFVGNIVYPIVAMRLKPTSVSGASNLNLIKLQSGN